MATYTLTWHTTTGSQARAFPSFEEAQAFAEATLLDDHGIAGPVIPNHPDLESADDRLYHGGNKYAGITRIA